MASLRFSKLFFQIANEVLQSLFGQWIDRPGGHSARLFKPAAPIPAGRYCRPIIGYWRLRFVMEDRDLAVALPQFNVVTEYDSKSTVATRRPMRRPFKQKTAPVRAAFGSYVES